MDKILHLIESCHTLYTQLRSAKNYALSQDVFEIISILEAQKAEAVKSNSTDGLCGDPTDKQLLNWGDMKVEKIELVGLGWSVDGAPKENTLRKALTAAMQKDKTA